MSDQELEDLILSVDEDGSGSIEFEVSGGLQHVAMHLYLCLEESILRQKKTFLKCPRWFFKQEFLAMITMKTEAMSVDLEMMRAFEEVTMP
jgi:hypothetical protein